MGGEEFKNGRVDKWCEEVWCKGQQKWGRAGRRGSGVKTRVLSVCKIACVFISGEDSVERESIDTCV